MIISFSDNSPDWAAAVSRCTIAPIIPSSCCVTLVCFEMSTINFPARMNPASSSMSRRRPKDEGRHGWVFGLQSSVLKLDSTNELLSLLASHDLNINAVFFFDLGNKVGHAHVRLGREPRANK